VKRLSGHGERTAPPQPHSQPQRQPRRQALLPPRARKLSSTCCIRYRFEDEDSTSIVATRRRSRSEAVDQREPDRIEVGHPLEHGLSPVERDALGHQTRGVEPLLADELEQSR
jgi:hypothetical protein